MKRRGRTESGTVRVWAEAAGVTKNIEEAFGVSTYQQDIFHKVMNYPVYVGPLGKTAGWCFAPCPKAKLGWIELHENLPRFGMSEVADTLLHEVGHLIDYHERREMDHSKEWKAVMARLGRPNETMCHVLPTSELDALWTFYCPGCMGEVRTRKPETVLHKRRCPYGCQKRVTSYDEAKEIMSKYPEGINQWPEEVAARLLMSAGKQERARLIHQKTPEIRRLF